MLSGITVRVSSVVSVCVCVWMCVSVCVCVCVSPWGGFPYHLIGLIESRFA